MHRPYYVLMVTAFFICAPLCEPSAAQAVNDGFQGADKIESRYFTVFFDNGVDLNKLTMRLSVPSSIRAIIKKPADIPDSYSLSGQLDLLFLGISEIMDIRLKKFKCKIKICKDASRLADVTERLFGERIKSGGFYVAEIDTLYIDAENVTLYILGHELSHAIQTHYFVVPPPATIQEVLSGYVEYQLRKYTNTLPVTGGSK